MDLKPTLRQATSLTDLSMAAGADQPDLGEASNRREELMGATVNDFVIRSTVGCGSFATVRVCQHHPSGRVYAVKMIAKELVIQMNQLDSIKREKDIMLKMSHPMIMSMYCSFQDSLYVYFCLEFNRGGELYAHLRRVGKFTEDMSKFYAASVVLALDYMHSKNIAYRDLKPENLMLDKVGYLKVCDFGLAKYVPAGTKTFTFCGTPAYQAPEIILKKGHGMPVDWWALGVLICEFISGHLPFDGIGRLQTHKAILAGRVDYKGFSAQSKDITSQLLQPKKRKRLGRNGSEGVRSHSWFKGVDFEALLHRRMAPPIRIIDANDDSRMLAMPDKLVQNQVSTIPREQDALFAGF